MAKVLIDIPNETYEYVKQNYRYGIGAEVACKLGFAVAEGTLLPKGHGDLKDMNDLCYKSRYGCKGNCDYLHTCNLYSAPTIIEADKKEDINENN